MKSELFDLSGKTALVTGGGRGIGFALAKGLAEHGADVVIVARTKEQIEVAKQEIQADTNRKIQTFPFDLGNIKGIESLFENIVNKTNGIDILIKVCYV